MTIGTRVVRVSPVGNLQNPKKVRLELEDGKSETIAVDAPSHNEFMRMWKEAGAYFRIKWEKAPPPRKVAKKKAAKKKPARIKSKKPKGAS